MRNIKDEICDIVVSNPHGWSAILKTHKEYLDFLDETYPQFKDKFFKLSTKIYWLINDVKDFPVCPTCGKSYGQHMNVDSGGYPGHCSCRCTQLDKKVRDKNVATNMRLYGVRNGVASKQAREKYRKTCQEKWGVDNAFQSEEIKDRIVQSTLKHLGVRNSMQNPEVVAKARKTFIDRYHVNSPFQLSQAKRSKGEIEVFEFIKSLFNEYNVESSNISELGGLELDIWIPELRLGIEYDGTYWHSLPDMVKRDMMKDEMCLRKSIQLYRVKEFDWNNRKETVKMFFEQLKRGIKENE